MSQTELSLPALDPWQYRLVPQAGPAARRLAGYALEVGPDLPVLPLSDATGRACGWVLGFAIDLRGAGPLADGARLGAPTPFDPADPDGFVIALREVLAGRYVVFLDCAGQALAYSDIAGHVSCVHDRETGRIGSSAQALLGEEAYRARFDDALYAELGIASGGWIPGGLTAHRGLERLLPNHRLDMLSGGMRRFWPREEILEAADPEVATARFIALLQLQLKLLAQGPRRIALALTAGHDSRLLLAVAREIVAQIDPVTIVGSDRHTTDSQVARRIARRLGLVHRELPRRTASPSEQQLFLQRIGHCVGESNVQFHPSVRPIAQSHVFVGGGGGEVARAYFWRAADQPDSVIAPDMLVRRFGLRESGAGGQRVAARLEQWWQALGWQDGLRVLDMVHLEQLIGPWGGGQFCGDPTLVRYAPMLTQEGVRLMISLPPDWKRGNRLGIRVVELCWPELAEFPYNSLGRGRDLLLKLRRALGNPALVVRKLHKLRG